jgi:hypothetical protein
MFQLFRRIDWGSVKSEKAFCTKDQSDLLAYGIQKGMNIMDLASI